MTFFGISTFTDKNSIEKIGTFCFLCSIFFQKSPRKTYNFTEDTKLIRNHLSRYRFSNIHVHISLQNCMESCMEKQMMQNSFFWHKTSKITPRRFIRNPQNNNNFYSVSYKLVGMCWKHKSIIWNIFCV